MQCSTRVAEPAWLSPLRVVVIPAAPRTCSLPPKMLSVIMQQTVRAAPSVSAAVRSVGQSILG